MSSVDCAQIRLAIVVGVISLLLTACMSSHPGDQDIVYVACRPLDSSKAIEVSDVAELKRGNSSGGNDLHRLEDFIGKTTKGMMPGQTMDDIYVNIKDKSQIDISKIDRKAFSKVVPVLKTTRDVPEGGIVCADNLKQELTARDDTPETVLTFIRDAGERPQEGYIALKPLPKGAVVKYEDISDCSSMSNFCRFVAVADLPAGSVLTIADLKADMSKADEDKRMDAELGGDEAQKKIAFQDAYNFDNWNEHKLLKRLKKGEYLTESALGPQMEKVAFAAHDLKAGVPIKAADIVMKFVDAEKKNEQADISFIDNAVGEIPTKLIKSGVRINADDLKDPANQ